MLSYEKVQRKNDMMYTIHYHSDIDLLNVFDKTKGEEVTHKVFECSLGERSNINEGRLGIRTLAGLIECNGSEREFLTDAFLEGFSM